MKFDRELQLNILQSLNDVYPETLSYERINGYSDDNQRKFMANMFYLEEHGLIEAPAQRRNYGTPPIIITANITAAGIDFLADDGGLSAILNKVVVKFDPDDLCKLLSSRIDQLEISPEKKSTILSTIKSLPVETLGKFYTRLIDYGLDRAPDVYQLIQTYLEKSP